MYLLNRIVWLKMFMDHSTVENGHFTLMWPILTIEWSINIFNYTIRFRIYVFLSAGNTFIGSKMFLLKDINQKHKILIWSKYCKMAMTSYRKFFWKKKYVFRYFMYIFLSVDNILYGFKMNNKKVIRDFQISQGFLSLYIHLSHYIS